MARLTVKQAASTQAYHEARRNGATVTDAVASARWSNALTNSIRQTLATMNKRSKAGRKGWKTRRKNATKR